MGVERRLFDRDRLFARALRREHRVAGLEMADPGRLGAGRRRRPTGGEHMRRARQKLQIVEAIATRRGIPGDVAGRLVDEERLVIGVVELEIAGAQGEAAAHRLDRRIGAELRFEAQRDRHVGFERRPIGVEEPHVVEIEIVRDERHHPLRAAARLRFDAPAPLRPLRPDRNLRRLAGTWLKDNWKSS